MNNDDGIILQMQEDGVWGIKEEPYCTIEVATKEDYEGLQKALEKQTPRKPLEQRYVNYEIENELIGHCPSCRLKWDVAFWQRHCSNCGQRLDWRVEE